MGSYNDFFEENGSPNEDFEESCGDDCSYDDYGEYSRGNDIGCLDFVLSMVVLCFIVLSIGTLYFLVFKGITRDTIILGTFSAFSYIALWLLRKIDK